MFEIFDNDLSGFNTLEDQESRDLYPIKPEPYCVVEGTYYNLPKTADLMREWVEDIMETDEDWQLASEPDQGELDEEWGLVMDLDSRLLLEHLATKKRMLTRKLATFQKMLNNNGLSAGTAKEMKPQRRNGVMMMRVVWPMEDGQTISAVFQVMGELSNKQIQPNTEMVTFQWKVNSKDVTRFLYTIDRKASSENRASRKGLSPQMLAKKLGAYVKANTESFTKRKAETEQLTKDLESQSSVNDTLDNELETARSGISEIEARIEANDAEIASLESELSGLLDQIEELKKKPIGPADGEDRSASDEEDADTGDSDGEWRNFTEDGFIDMAVGLGKRAHTELELELSDFEEDPEIQKYLNSDMPNSFRDLLKRFWETGWKAAREEFEDAGLGSFDDGSDSSSNDLGTGMEAVEKLANHPYMTRTLTALNNALAEAGIENLNPTIFGRSPSSGGDVETLRTRFKEVVQRSAKAEEGLEEDDGLDFTIEMLNQIGTSFFSDPISGYMKENGLTFFDLYEISGSTGDLRFRLERQHLDGILAQLAAGESEEEEEETGGASSFEAGTYDYWVNIIGAEMRTQAGRIYNSINSAATMLLRYRNQVQAATSGPTYTLENMEQQLFNMVANRLPEVMTSYNKLELPDVMKAVDMAVTKEAENSEMDPDAITKIVNSETFERRYNYDAADLGDNSEDDVEPVDDTDTGPEPEDEGGGDEALEAEAQRLLNSDDMEEVAEWFGDNADMLQAANMELFDKLNDHMIELAMAA